MKQNTTFRTSLLAAAIAFTPLAATPAFAVSKEQVQLQTQIQQLQDAVARLQQSNDERMGVLKDLVQQSADSVNKMSVTIDGLQKQLQVQQGAENTKVDGVSGQVQALNDSVDELKARMARLEKLLKDIQGSQQSISAGIQSMPQQTAPLPSNPTQSTVAPTADNPAPIPAPDEVKKPTKPSPVVRLAPPPAQISPASSAPPADDLYKSAMGDYMAAKDALASSEFGDVIKNYPDNTLAGNSYYYVGEIDYRFGKYTAAARDYDKVIEQFPDSNKVPASHLHKGQALIQMKQNDAGVREFRALIQRFPNSPEAMQARSKLNAMGVAVKPKTP
jgi:TolA-binding protein